MPNAHQGPIFLWPHNYEAQQQSAQKQCCPCSQRGEGRKEVGNGGNVYAINAQLKIKTDTMAGPQRNNIQKGQSPQSLQFIRAQWREGEEGSVECGV